MAIRFELPSPRLCLLQTFRPAQRISIPLRIDTMDTQSLRTASTYINNLLLSRGLLRNGTSIEFAAPAKAEGGVNATMAKVINLVHDLVLRRDVC